jgi:hypothetical protein
MYCPKCSQAQVSDEMRYCSRCGFPLGTVSVLLNHNGTIPFNDESKNLQRSPRERIATESLIMIVFSWAVALGATFWFDAGGPVEFIAKVGSCIFFVLGLIGLVRFLYAFLFMKPLALQVESSQYPKDLSRSDENAHALPPPQATPLSDWPRRTATREIVSNPSVTENTTRLLDE